MMTYKEVKAMPITEKQLIRKTLSRILLLAWEAMTGGQSSYHVGSLVYVEGRGYAVKLEIAGL